MRNAAKIFLSCWLLCGIAGASLNEWVGSMPIHNDNDHQEWAMGGPMAMSQFPLADVTLTVNPGGGAMYTSLSAAEAALPSPLDDNYIISCAGATDDTTPALIDVATLNGGTQHTLLIQGDNTSGVFDDSKYQLKMTGVSVTNLTLAATSPYTTIRNLQLTGYTTGSASYHAIICSADYCTLEKNIIKDVVRGGNYAGIYVAASIVHTKIWNNVIYNCTQGFHAEDCKVIFSHNTIAASLDYGVRFISGAATTLYLYDNLLTGSGIADYSKAGVYAVASQDNYTSDTSSPDGAGYQGKTFTFVGAPNYHLDAGEDGKYGCTNPAANGPTTDIDGQTRTDFDAGFDELMGGGSGGTTNQIWWTHRRHRP